MGGTMRTVRASYRLFLLLVITGGLTMVWLIRIPFLSSVERSAWRGVMTGLWARRFLHVLNVQVHVDGIPPDPPFFMVSNHLSYMDIIVYLSQVHCVFLAKSEVAYWPVLGWLARAVGTLFVNRRNSRDVVRINEEIDRVLGHNEGIVIFPEGTTSKGESVLPFKTGILETVARRGMPVSYAAVSYRTPENELPAMQVVCWWGDMTLVDHLFNLLKLPSFEATIVFGDEALTASDRKEMAMLLNEKVSQHFIPVV